MRSLCVKNLLRQRHDKAPTTTNWETYCNQRNIVTGNRKTNWETYCKQINIVTGNRKTNWETYCMQRSIVTRERLMHLNFKKRPRTGTLNTHNSHPSAATLAACRTSTRWVQYIHPNTDIRPCSVTKPLSLIDLVPVAIRPKHCQP